MRNLKHQEWENFLQTLPAATRNNTNRDFNFTDIKTSF